MKAPLPEYDYVYNPKDWECTYSFKEELSEHYVKDSDVGTIFEAQTLLLGPKMYGARVPVSFDDDGDWDEEEVQWFATEEEAKLAINRKSDKSSDLAATQDAPA